MSFEQFDEMLDNLPEEARFKVLMLISSIRADKEIETLSKRVQSLEGSVATLRLRLSAFEKKIK